jgi:hypothetical protein
MAAAGPHVMIGPRRRRTAEVSEMAQQIEGIRKLEGQQVCMALADGSRIDDCSLVSAGRGRAKTIWVYVNGIDAFVEPADVVAVWEVAPGRGRCAA